MALIIQNIKTSTDFSPNAVGNGVTNDAPAFRAFNDWATANQGTDSVELDIPAGTYEFLTNAGPGNNNPFTNGVKSLSVVGSGSGTTTLDSNGGTAFTFGGNGVAQKGLAAATGGSARIQTAIAGSTTVTLTAASFAAGYISRFTVGNYMMIGGLNIQALWQSPFGFPQNVHYFEFVLITAIDTGAGVITFISLNTGAGLSNTYKSTWPEYNNGSNFEIDSGGPATIWALNASWGVTQNFSGLTLDTALQINSVGKTLSYNNMAMIGSGGQIGVIPSQNFAWSMTNADYTGLTMETDKLVRTMNIDGMTISQLKFQSSATDVLTANNLTATNNVTGTPKSTFITNSNISSLTVGAYAYGASDSIDCRDSVLSAVVAQGISQGSLSASHYTMSGGVITFPCSAQSGAQPSGRIFVPGHYCLWTGPFETSGSFKVIDITQDPWPGADYQTTSTSVTISSGSASLAVSGTIFAAGDVGKIIGIPGAGGSGTVLWAQISAFTDSQHVTLDTNALTSLSAATKTIEWGTANVYVQTNQTGGVPVNVTGVRTLPVRQATFRNCTGSQAALSLSLAPAAKPLWSYSKYTYSSPTYAMSAAGNLDTQKIWGNLISCKINVITPYAGAGSGTVNVGGQFQCNTRASDGSTFQFTPVINLKTPGERVITPAGNTGAQSGDTLTTVTEAVWFTDSLKPYLNQNLSSSPPVFTIEITTDQIEQDAVTTKRYKYAMAHI